MQASASVPVVAVEASFSFCQACPSIRSNGCSASSQNNSDFRSLGGWRSYWGSANQLPCHDTVSCRCCGHQLFFRRRSSRGFNSSFSSFLFFFSNAFSHSILRIDVFLASLRRFVRITLVVDYFLRPISTTTVTSMLTAEASGGTLRYLPLVGTAIGRFHRGKTESSRGRVLNRGYCHCCCCCFDVVDRQYSTNESERRFCKERWTYDRCRSSTSSEAAVTATGKDEKSKEAAGAAHSSTASVKWWASISERPVVPANVRVQVRKCRINWLTSVTSTIATVPATIFSIGSRTLIVVMQKACTFFSVVWRQAALCCLSFRIFAILRAFLYFHLPAFLPDFNSERFNLWWWNRWLGGQMRVEDPYTWVVIFFVNVMSLFHEKS